MIFSQETEFIFAAARVYKCRKFLKYIIYVNSPTTNRGMWFFSIQLYSFIRLRIELKIEL